MKILAVGGGSGGHVTPVVAVIDELHKLDASLEVRFVCDRAFEEQARGLMQRASVPVTISVITAGKFRRYKHLTFWQHFTVPGLVVSNVLDVFKVGIGFIQSFLLLLRHRPDAVFAKGGYVCLPVGYAARLLRIPLVIHDSDTRPGLTNRLLAGSATVIATGYPLENYPYDTAKSHYVGVPIGAEFRPVPPERQAELKQALGYQGDTPLIIATGGGLGARSINEAMLISAPELAGEGAMIYVIAGKEPYEELKDRAGDVANFTAVPFVYEGMAGILGAADVVVARGSATFLQELANLEKAVVIIPAKQLGDQLQNAAMYKAADAAVVIDDANLTEHPGLLTDTLRDLLNDPSKRSVFASKLHSFARPDAAKDLAVLIVGAQKK